MNKPIKVIKHIDLEASHPLNSVLMGLADPEVCGHNEASIDRDKFMKTFLEVDKNAVRLDKYDSGCLTDINRGHWDIYQEDNKSGKTQSVRYNIMGGEEVVARSPILDVKEGVVAIDFGTKSTVAAFLDDQSNKKLIRIGSGKRGLENKKHYENPTVIEFMDIDSFMNEYNKFKSRPFTSIEQICVSHEAQDKLKDAEQDDFYRFFGNLKQWAASSGTTYNIKDKKNHRTLKNFLDCGDKDLNPIEIYAYYIGRYINNMTNGIYLEYLLSYPVKYSLDVRKKIQESFERGLRKSIPDIVLSHNNYKDRFKVELSASEPAAYAISALKEYGFYSQEYLNQVVHYGVFDFGGGTTDFDFGMWKGSKKSRYDFDIEHFGEGGDPYLGGENLLELLVYEVVKDNRKEIIENNFSFTKPENVDAFGGSEAILKNSQEARKNTGELVERLREFWENLDQKCEENREIFDRLRQGEIPSQLVNNFGEIKTLDLKVNTDKLMNILRQRIASGVDQFYQSLKEVADRLEGLETLHIFLGGNSSRSILVKEAFENLIERVKQEGDKTNFKLYPPLGTDEADEMRKELGLEAQEEEMFKQVTCKTGVVFGLLDGRRTGKINVVSEVKNDEEAKFNFHLGEERMGCFNLLINKNDDQLTRNGRLDLFNCPDDIDSFELYYTKDARATTNKLKIQDGVKKKILKLDKIYDEKYMICITVTGPDTIKYGVYEDCNIIKEFDDEIKLD